MPRTQILPRKRKTVNKKPSPGRRAREIPIAPPRLDPRGEKLFEELKGVLSPDLKSEIGICVDIVTITVPKESLVQVCRFLKDAQNLSFDYLCAISVVDYEESEQRFEIVYHMVSLSTYYKVAVKTSVASADPVLPTVTSVWRSAEWFEREGHDLFGVIFLGHSNLSPFLLYEGFDGFPGRKSFPFHDYQEW